MDERLTSHFQHFLEDYSVIIQQKIEEQTRKIHNKKGYITEKDINKVTKEINKKYKFLHIEELKNG